jgi:hypothetical protein
VRETTIDPNRRTDRPRRVRGRAPRLDLDAGHRPASVTAQQAPRPSTHLAASSSRVVERMDRAVARVLHVEPGLPAPRQAVATTGSRPFETPLLVSAVRCTLRYIVLPFVLPLLGLAAGAALGLLLMLDVIAAIAIVATLRRLWRLQHPRRWQYLLVALALAVLVGFFFVSDARMPFV